MMDDLDLNENESAEEKVTISVSMPLDLHRMTESRLGSYMKEYIETLVKSELERALNLGTKRDLYILNFEKEFKEKFSKISKEIVFFTMGQATFDFTFLSLPYSPILVVDIEIGLEKIYIKFKSKPGAKSFRINLRKVFDLLDGEKEGKNKLRRQFEAVLAITMKISGEEENVKQDVGDLYELITKLIQRIYDLLCDDFKKKKTTLKL